MWLEYISNYTKYNSFEFRIYSWIKNLFEFRILGINRRINSKNMDYELSESSCKWFRRFSFRPTSSKSNQWETIRRKTFSNSHDRLLNGRRRVKRHLTIHEQRSRIQLSSARAMDWVFPYFDFEKLLFWCNRSFSVLELFFNILIFLIS